MTDCIKISKRFSCDDTHINKHIKKDTPLSDVPHII